MKLFKYGAFAVLLVLTAVSGLSAQNVSLQDIKVAPAPLTERVCTFEPTGINTRHFIDHEDIVGKRSSMQASSQFNVTYVNACGGQTWPSQARQAFDHAMRIWETHLQSSVPVRIEATWRQFESENDRRNVLGSAGPTLIAQVPEPIGQNDTWYSVAQASAMTGQDIVGGSPNAQYDIRININCDYSAWYFGTDANTPEDLIDFVTVVLHEVGHGIGFIGSMRADKDTEVAEWGFESSTTNRTFPIIYDQFVEDGNGNEILDESVYFNPSGALFRGLTGNNNGLFFVGFDAAQVFNGAPVPIYAPSTFRPGSSYSHLDQDTFGNTENALMRPRIDSQSATHTPGPVMCGMLSDMGWPMGANCNSLLGIESAISVSTEPLNFGVSNIGSRVTQTFRIENLPSAEDPLSGLISFENDNFSVSASQERFTIQPGGAINAAVRYDPSAASIDDSELLLFHNSSLMANPVRIELNAEALERSQEFALDQNYPNPFNTQTRIEYALTGSAYVRLDIFNSSGQLIETLVDGEQSEGRYVEPFDAGTRGLASGMYIYRILVDGMEETRKLLFVK